MDVKLCAKWLRKELQAALHHAVVVDMVAADSVEVAETEHLARAVAVPLSLVQRQGFNSKIYA
jgi:hypothetical protein